MYIRRIAIFDMSLDNENLPIPTQRQATKYYFRDEIYIAVIGKPD